MDFLVMYDMLVYMCCVGIIGLFALGMLTGICVGNARRWRKKNRTEKQADNSVFICTHVYIWTDNEPNFETKTSFKAIQEIT